MFWVLVQRETRSSFCSTLFRTRTTAALCHDGEPSAHPQSLTMKIRFKSFQRHGVPRDGTQVDRINSFHLHACQSEELWSYIRAEGVNGHHMRRNNVLPTSAAQKNLWCLIKIKLKKKWLLCELLNWPLQLILLTDRDGLSSKRWRTSSLRHV